MTFKPVQIVLAIFVSLTCIIACSEDNDNPATAKADLPYPGAYDAKTVTLRGDSATIHLYYYSESDITVKAPDILISISSQYMSSSYDETTTKGAITSHGYGSGFDYRFKYDGRDMVGHLMLSGNSSAQSIDTTVTFVGR